MTASLSVAKASCAEIQCLLKDITNTKVVIMFRCVIWGMMRVGLGLYGGPDNCILEGLQEQERANTCILPLCCHVMPCVSL